MGQIFDGGERRHSFEFYDVGKAQDIGIKQFGQNRIFYKINYYLIIYNLFLLFDRVRESEKLKVHVFIKIVSTVIIGTYVQKRMELDIPSLPSRRIWLTMCVRTVVQTARIARRGQIYSEYELMISTITLTTLLITWVAELPRPNWQRDYASAYKTATEQKKPLAIFLGHGADGFKTLVKDGVLSQDDAKKLNDEFVPFYIDTDSKEGQELAKSFEMSEGLVISDHTGLRQAVRYEGQVSKPELTEMLSTYSQPNRAVVTTENRGRFRGAIRSVITAPVQFMGGNGTCRTGNCPNR